MLLKSLTKEAVEIFESLKEKIGNNTKYLQAGECFDPLSFEKIMPPVTQTPKWLSNPTFYAVSNFYIQNGDVMRVPEYCICECEIEGKKQYIPYLFRLDSVGLYQESVLFENGQYIPKMQKSHRDGAVDFLRGLKANGYLNQDPKKYEELKISRYDTF